jgi:Protein of unknown function (DUF1360)
MPRSIRSMAPVADSSAAGQTLALVVDALATYRLTRLVTADVISEPFRRSIVGRAMGWRPDDAALLATTAQEVVDSLDDPPKSARLITCRWCAGMWIAGGVVAARRLTPRGWDPVSRALALSGVAVLVSRLEDG